MIASSARSTALRSGTVSVACFAFLLMAASVFDADPAIARNRHGAFGQPMAAQADADNPLLFDDEFNGTTDQLYSVSNLRDPFPKNTDKTWNIFGYSADPNHLKDGHLWDYVFYQHAITETDGALHITAQKLTTPLQMWNRTFDTITGRIDSVKAFDHGYFEIKAKVPAAQGLWPAIWLFSPDHNTSEIDILEGTGTKPGYAANIYWHSDANLGPGSAATTVVMQVIPEECSVPAIFLTRGMWAQGPFAKDRYPRPFSFAGQCSPMTEYHVYGLDWQKSGITFYLDGHPFFHTTRTINEPMRLIMNLALGGSGGAVTAATPFPSPLDVDYVRVYDHMPSPQKGRPPTLKLSASLPGKDLPEHKFVNR